LEQKDCDKGTRQFFCRMLMHVFISLHHLDWNAMHPY
jgi:hypothetical protein